MLMTVLYVERAHTLYSPEHVLAWLQVCLMAADWDGTAWQGKVQRESRCWLFLCEPFISDLIPGRLSPI
jgi:hypothetical protein